MADAKPNFVIKISLYRQDDSTGVSVDLDGAASAPEFVGMMLAALDEINERFGDDTIATCLGKTVISKIKSAQERSDK